MAGFLRDTGDFILVTNVIDLLAKIIDVHTEHRFIIYPHLRKVPNTLQSFENIS